MVAKHRNLTEKEKKIWSLLDSGTADAVKEVMDNEEGAWDVDCCDEHGTTPLMQAAFKGNKDVCLLLLKCAADVNANTHDSSYTPLMFAALSGNSDLCRVLLQNGAKAYRVNSIGRTAAEMAAFTGQHHCVSVINNFVAQDDIDVLLQPNPNEPPRMPVRFAPVLHELSRTYNIHPVKTVLFLVNHTDLLAHRKQMLIIFEELYERQMKTKDVNEVMAIKLHIIFTTLKEGFSHLDKDNADDSLDVATMCERLKLFVKWLLVAKQSSHFTENMEYMLRRCIQKFPYHQSVLFQTIVRQLADTKIGATPTAINVIQQVILGHRQAIDTHFCATCGEPRAAKRCAQCKMVNYCTAECQRLHWFTHKKWCGELAKEYELIKAEQTKQQLLQQTQADEQSESSVAVDDVAVQLDKLTAEPTDNEGVRKRNVKREDNE